MGSNASRRALLSTGSAGRGGSELLFASQASALATDKTCSKGYRYDPVAKATELRAAKVETTAEASFIPSFLPARGNVASGNLMSETPTRRIGEASNLIRDIPPGVRFKANDKEPEASEQPSKERISLLQKQRGSAERWLGFAYGLVRNVLGALFAPLRWCANEGGVGQHAAGRDAESCLASVGCAGSILRTVTAFVKWSRQPKNGVVLHSAVSVNRTWRLVARYERCDHKRLSKRVGMSIRAAWPRGVTCAALITGLLAWNSLAFSFDAEVRIGEDVLTRFARAVLAQGRVKSSSHIGAWKIENASFDVSTTKILLRGVVTFAWQSQLVPVPDNSTLVKLFPKSRNRTIAREALLQRSIVQQSAWRATRFYSQAFELPVTVDVQPPGALRLSVASTVVEVKNEKGVSLVGVRPANYFNVRWPIVVQSQNVGGVTIKPTFSNINVARLNDGLRARFNIKF